MTPPTYPTPADPTEDELHAFIDDELTPERRAEIAVVLRENPALAARVAAYEADRDLLRMAFAGMAEEPIPAAWVARIDAAMAVRRRPVVSRRFALAGGMALAASVAGLVWWKWPRDHTILAEAEAARDGQLGGRLAGGDPLPPPASRDALLRSALRMNVRAPDLRRFGFQLARIELFNRSDGAAAQLSYSDPEQRALTIFVRPSDGTVRFDLLRRGTTRVCVWQDDVVGAVIIAPVSAAEMLHIATAAYSDLNL
jgi:anti-sigma factor RsiW